jgi:hypothetical protein
MDVVGPDESGSEYGFVVPKQGWVFISNCGSDSVHLKSINEKSGHEILLNEKNNGAHEAMRYLMPGKYNIKTQLAKNLIIRTIPQLVFADFQSKPIVEEFGVFQGDFQKKYIFKNTNVLICRDYGLFPSNLDSAMAQDWKRNGKKWLVECEVAKGTEENPLTIEAAYKYLTEHKALNTELIDGLIANEFVNSAPYCTVWAKAVDRTLSEPKYQDKVYYPYADNLWDGPQGIELLKVLAKHHSAVAWERYLKEQRSEAEAWRFLKSRLVDDVEKYRTKLNTSPANLVVCYGYFTTPPETLDTFPHVNYKTFLDMQFNLVANHPAFDGIGGIMTYLADYADEETVRWAARLMRHYGIEGKTQMLSNDSYLLTHLENPDFEQGSQGWTTLPAASGSIWFDQFAGFGWLQGRYPRTSEGDQVIVTKRSANKPNIFCQEMKNLQPGRLYSFRVYCGDFNDLSVKQKYAFSVEISNVTVIPEKTFVHVNANCYDHHVDPYNEKHKAWMNYCWQVFRAKKDSAKLTISDWKSRTEPGGSIGQKLMFNFIEVQPYLEE